MEQSTRGRRPTMLARLLLVVAIVGLFAIAPAACGGDSVAGTYKLESSDSPAKQAMRLTLNDDKTAAITVNGQAATGNYVLTDTGIVVNLTAMGQSSPAMVGKVDGDKIVFTSGETWVKD